MSFNQDVFNSLLDMGIDAPLARAASARFGAADAAVNWCFSDAGAKWTPDEDQKAQLPDYATPGATVTHHEVYDQSGRSSMSNSPNPFHSPNPQTQQQGQQAVPPPVPPRRANLSTLPSNNPFRNNPPPPDVTVVDDDEDEDLRKAIAISRGEIGDGHTADGMENDNEGRHERERSVRASGVPPPSPEGEDLSKGVVFGPTEKDDPEGKMSLVPGTPGPVNNISKEDEELNRAIQDSLMTASFHSASAAQEADKPVQSVRQPGAPQVLYSQSGSSTYAANYLQGLLAIPQFREAIVASQYTERGDAKLYTTDGSDLMNLQSLIEQQKTDLADFVEIDQTLRELRNGAEPNQLPPANPAVEFHTQMTVFANDVLCTARATGAFDDKLASAAYIEDPTALFTSKVIAAPVDRPTYLNVYRGSDPANRQLLGAFAGIMWGADHPNAAIEEFSDIIMIRLGWDWGAPKELWQLEERVVLDRFTKENAKRSFQIRADQAVAGGEARRLKEKIDKLSNYNGESTLESLRVLVKHYESTPASGDPIQEESRRELKAKLADLLANIEAHKTALDEQLAKHEAAQSSAAFDSEDPELNRHSYLLRAVLFHDGITVPGQHLYAYIRHEDGKWWKVQEHRATQVDFEAVAGDRTGLFMDGGPYMLLYSREGPRPAPPGLSLDEDLIDTAPPNQPPVMPSMSQDTVAPDEDNLMSFDDTPPNKLEAPKQPES